MKVLALFALLGALSASASPILPTPVLTARGKKTTCVVPYANGADDTPAIEAVAAKCASNAVIEFKEGVDYNILTPVKMVNLTNVEIRVNGNLHLPKNMTVVTEEVAKDAGYMLAGMRWINFGGKGVHYRGSKNVTGGWIEGYGQQYWDANPVNGTGIDNRPKLIKWSLQDSTIRYLKVHKPPAWTNSIEGNNITVQDVFLDSSTRPGGGYPFNTDGFGLVNATNIVLKDMTILNGDDAVAVNNGTSNVLIQNVYAGGPGCHGMSIGSLGRDNTAWQGVSNIHFKDITMVGALYAARFKSYDGGQGLVSNITWENFKIENVTYPIYVTQTYHNQGSLQTQNGAQVVTNVTGQAVEMENFTWKNWRGTINSYQPGDGSCASDPCWYEAEGQDQTQAVLMTCATETSCRNFRVDNVQVVPQDSTKQASIMCTNVGAASNPDFGIGCINGTYVPLK